MKLDAMTLWRELHAHNDLLAKCVGHLPAPLASEVKVRLIHLQHLVDSDPVIVDAPDPSRGFCSRSDVVEEFKRELEEGFEIETPAALDIAGDRMIKQMLDDDPELEDDLRQQLKPGAAEVLGLVPEPAWAETPDKV